MIPFLSKLALFMTGFLPGFYMTWTTFQNVTLDINAALVLLLMLSASFAIGTETALILENFTKQKGADQ